MALTDKKQWKGKKKTRIANDLKLLADVARASLLLTFDLTGVSLSTLDLERRRWRRPQMRLELRVSVSPVRDDGAERGPT